MTSFNEDVPVSDARERNRDDDDEWKKSEVESW